MKRSTLQLAGATLALAGLAVWYWTRPSPVHNAFQVRELATQRLAVALGKQFPSQRLLIVSNPYVQRKGVAKDIVGMEEAGVRGLKKGMGKTLTLEAVAYPDLRSEAHTSPRSALGGVETSTPMSYLVADDAFDKLATQHPNAAVIVSLIGLPLELNQTRCWTNDAPPAFGLLLPDLRMIGNAAAVQAAFKRGKLAAFVADKPGAPSAGDPVGKDAAVEFDKRFVLVTAENFDQVRRDYPQIFPAN